MAITNFVRMEFNRVIHEELIDTKFADFGQGLMSVFFTKYKTCKNAYISYGDNGRSGKIHFFSVGNPGLKAPFCLLMAEIIKRSMLVVIVLYLTLI